MTHWFAQWDKRERQEFLHELSLLTAPDPTDTLLNAAFNAVTLTDRPMSLFRCQLKLFKEWFPMWPDCDKELLLDNVRRMDAEFFSQYQSAISQASCV